MRKYILCGQFQSGDPSCKCSISQAIASLLEFHKRTNIETLTAIITTIFPGKFDKKLMKLITFGIATSHWNIHSS